MLDQLPSESEDEDDTYDVVLEPPTENPFAQSDEDSDLSDAEATSDVIRLPGRILRSAAMLNRHELEISSDVQNSSMLTENQGSSKRKKNFRKWNKKSAEVAIDLPSVTTDNDISHPSRDSPLACFEKVFPREIVEHIVEQTNRYSMQKGRNVNVTIHEVLGIIGLMIYSGYNSIHGKEMLWSSDEDVCLQWAKDLMPKNRFKDIFRDLHLADNTSLNPEDPYYKVRPFFEMLNDSFRKSLPLDENLSVDEIMVPYFGRHGTKQFIRGKPIRYGYKIWALASSKGYIYQVEPYCGKMTNLETTGKGQGYDVVMGLLKKADVPGGKRIFFDNLFTSLDLLDELSSMNIGGCGTMRENRLGGAPITNKKIFEKLSRGTSEHMSDGKTLLVRWNDNKAVTVCTNFVPLDPHFETTRYVKKEGGHVRVRIPGPLHAYNQYMGGVDLFDQCLSNYRCSMRSKKWWWPLFQWGVDAARTNSWFIHRRTIRGGKQLPFIRELAKVLIKKNTVPRPAHHARYRRPSGVQHDVRFDMMNHWPKVMESRYHRCQQCGNRTQFACEKCNVPLHPICFQPYHNPAAADA